MSRAHEAIKILLVVTGLAAAVAGCRRTPEGEQPQDGDTIIIGMVGRVEALNPLLSGSTRSRRVQGLVLTPLVSGSGGVQVARSWDVSLQPPTVTYYLSRGLRWSDGEGVTARDVSFTFERLREWSAVTAGLEQYRDTRVRSEVIGTHEIRFVFPEGQRIDPVRWGEFFVLPEHVLKYTVDMALAEFSRRPVGSGPFRVVKWVEDDRIELVPEPAFNGTRPHVDRVLIRFFPDEEMMGEAARKGEIDLLEVTSPRLLEQLQGSTEFRVFGRPTPRCAVLLYNLRHPVVTERAVREAIDLVVDREVLVNDALKGLAVPILGIPIRGEGAKRQLVLPESTRGQPKSSGTGGKHDETAHHPERVDHLLNEAGWGSKDGRAVRQKGRFRLELTLVFDRNNQAHEAAARLVRAAAGEVGIRVTPVAEDFISLLWRLYRGDFEISLLDAEVTQAQDLYDLWHSRGRYNLGGWSDSGADRALERMVAGSERGPVPKEEVGEFGRVLSEQKAASFLFQREEVWALAERIRGLEEGGDPWEYLSRLWIPAERQRYGRERAGSKNG
jgi:peptide/nickel transport system substrate-binding protein